MAISLLTWWWWLLDYVAPAMTSVGASFGVLYIQQKRVENKVKRAEEREKGRKKFGGNSKKIHPAGRSSADTKGSSEQAKDCMA